MSVARPLAATSALLVAPEHAVDLVLAFALESEGHDLAVAVAPEELAALGERIGAEAQRRGVDLAPDIALVECADRAALRTLLARADRVIDSGCLYLADDADVPSVPAAAPLRAPRDVVLVNTYPSEPARHGGGVRVRELWRAMPADVGARAVVLHHAGLPGATVGLTRARPGTEVQVEIWPQLLRTFVDLTGKIGASADDLAAALVLGPDDPFGHALRDAVAAGADGLVLVHPYLIRQALAAAPHLPLVYDAQNVEADLKSAMYDDGEAGREATRLVTLLEADACAQAVAVICCTDEDRDRMAQLHDVPRERLHVIPNGVAVREAALVPWADRAHAAPRCVFTGSGHGPNVEAAETVIAAAAALPAVGFDLVGTLDQALAGRELPANVVVHGRVSDVVKQRLFAAATLALNPMRTGSGSNLKIADYAAAGLPILTSAVGARGFAPLGDCVTLVDAGPEGWAAAIEAALGEDWTARTTRARAVVEREYDWAALAVRYADVLHAALGA